VFNRFKKQGVALCHNYQPSTRRDVRKWDWHLTTAYNHAVMVIILGVAIGVIAGFAIELIWKMTAHPKIVLTNVSSIGVCTLVAIVTVCYIRRLINKQEVIHRHRWALVDKLVYQIWREMIDAHYMVVSPATNSILIGGILLLDMPNYKALAAGDAEVIATTLDEILAKHFIREAADLRFTECDEAYELDGEFEI
jgi:hypothetical protein